MEDFIKSLKSEGKSKNSIKNYKADINQFLSWHRETTPNLPLRDSLNSTYITYLMENYSKNSVKRKLSSINSYLHFLHKGEQVAAKPVKQSFLARLRQASLPILSTSFSLTTLAFLIYLNSESLNPTENLKIIPQNVDVNPKSLQSFQRYSTDSNIDLVVSAPEEYGILAQEQIIDETMQGYSYQGQAQIPPGEKEVTIYSNAIKKGSFIALTALTHTLGNTLYIKAQGEGYTIIGIEKAVEEEYVKFSWLVFNTNYELIL